MSSRKPLSSKKKEALKRKLTRLAKSTEKPEITRWDENSTITRLVDEKPIRRVLGPDGDKMTIRRHGRPLP
jgi:hypothetical protein